MDLASDGYSVAAALRRAGPAALAQALGAVRARTLRLADAYAAALGPGLVVACDAGRNPPLWELGHLAWFQEYWIGRNRHRAAGVQCDPAHARGASQLARADSWYDSSQVAHASRWTLPLPSAGDTRAYLHATLAQTLVLLHALPADAGDDALYFFRLVCLHEAMHAEAAHYMARSLGIALAPPAPAHGRAARAESIQVPAQNFRLGHDGPGFAFDNERVAHEVAVDEFVIDAQPVSWARFVPFATAGGYDQRRWWSDAGWAWRQQAQPAPARQPMADPDAPAVHLSAHEAEAWCRWAGRRLPTEAQWECAVITQPALGWGRVWEWTASDFAPYPGFTPHPYRDYSAPWFGSHRVLRGACDATAAELAHPRYRNFFEPHRTDIFAGFRSCA